MTVPVTVLMSVYNGERWLHESIPSILNQSFDNFEFVIVNDGSTDGTLEIINEYGRKDKRIRLVDKPNTGLVDSLNSGLRISNGEWIARMDADDLSAPNRLNEQYRYVNEDSSLVLLGSGLKIIDQYSQVGKTYCYPSGHDQLKTRLLGLQAFFAHSSAFYSIRAVQQAGGYRARIRRAQDIDLWLRLMELGRLGCHPDPLVSIRKHTEQVSNESGGKRQTQDAFVGLCSYLIRSRNKVDPVEQICSDEQFNNFRQHIVIGLEQDGIYDYQSLVVAVKSIVNKRTIPGFMSLIPMILSKPNMFIRYFIAGLHQRELAQRLADDWIERGPKCAA